MHIKTKYPLPKVYDLFDRLYGAQVFSKIDTRFGYYQLKTKKEDASDIDFRTWCGRCEFLIMSFGLTNAHAAFMYLMDRIFQPLLDHCIIAFVDDILLYGRGKRVHKEHLRNVLSILREKKLYKKSINCEFFVERSCLLRPCDFNEMHLYWSKESWSGS